MEWAYTQCQPVFAMLEFHMKHRFHDSTVVHLCRALPGLNSAGVGLIVASVFQLGLKIRTLSPFPEASVCIGELRLAGCLPVPASSAL